MAKLHNAFDSSNYDDDNFFDPIPAGKYMVQITGSDIKKTKDGTGKYIAFEFTVLQGEYKGRKIWTNLNIVNKNPVAVEIAEKELAAICRAVGKPVIQDTEELHGIPFQMRVKITPGKGQYPPKNAPAAYASLKKEATYDFEDDPKEPEPEPEADNDAPEKPPWEADSDSFDDDIPF